jgi:hypothetical protein
MLNWYISLLALCISVATFAQQTTKKVPPKIAPMERPVYIRIGVDPSRYLYRYIDNSVFRSGFEISLDTEVKQRYFPVFELGTETFTLDKERLLMDGSGVYLRAGVDQNLMRNQNPNDRDMFYIGVRFGYAFLSQDANRILVDNGIDQSLFNFEGVNYNATWGELCVGVKTELGGNFFLGWSVRLKKRFSVSQREVIPYIIPGYGKYTNSINVAPQFSFMYAIPIKKVKE